MNIDDFPPDVQRQIRRKLAQENRVAVSPADLERLACHESMATGQGAPLDTPCRLRVICHRKRLADYDGISCKALTDGLVRSGVLVADSAQAVVQSPEILQIKDREEQTIVEVWSVEGGGMFKVRGGVTGNITAS